MEKIFYKHLHIADLDSVSDHIKNSMILCGKNWDFYFEKRPKSTESETLKNINLIKFETSQELESHLKSKQKNQIIDFEIDSNDNFFACLEYAKD